MGYKHNQEDILEMGYQVIRKRGYHNTGINHILQESGIPKGSFYNFFKSKQDFAIKMIERYGENNKNWIENFFTTSSESPLNALRSFYRLLIDLNEQDEYSSGCIVNSLSNEVGRNDDGLAHKMNAQFLGWIDVISEVVKKGQETEEITNAYSAEDIAEYLHAGMYGGFPRMKVTRSRAYLDQWYDMTFDFITK